MTDLTRRDVLRSSAVVAGVTAAGASTTSPVAAQTTDDPWEDYSITQATKDALTAGNAVAIGVDYLFGTDYVGEARTRLANHAHRSYGDMRDYGGYTGGDALASEIYIGVVEMEQADEKVMTSIQNNIASSDNVAIAKGQVAIAEALNDGKSESEAQNDMEAAIDEYFSKIQQNIVNHWNTQIDQAGHHVDQIYEHSDTTLLHFRWRDPDGSAGSTWDNRYQDHSVQVYSVDLLDGTSTDLKFLEYVYDGSGAASAGDTSYLHPNHFPHPDGNFAEGALEFNEDTSDWDDGGNQQQYVQQDPFDTALDDLSAQRDSVYSELSGYVTDVYAAYEPGEVDVSEVVDPTTYATELSTDNNRGFRQAAASHLGIPTAAEEHVIIELHDQDNERVWTDLYTDYTPTDSDGNEVGFEVGTKYKPTNWTEPLFVVFEDDEGNADMAQLEEPFTIVNAYDQDGNEIDTFHNTQTTTHTSDVSQFQDELNQLREEQLRLIEKFAEDDDGSGGETDTGGLLDALGFTVGGLEVPGTVTAIAGTGAVAYGAVKAGVIGASNSPAGQAAKRRK